MFGLRHDYVKVSVIIKVSDERISLGINTIRSIGLSSGETTIAISETDRQVEITNSKIDTRLNEIEVSVVIKILESASDVGQISGYRKCCGICKTSRSNRF